MISQELWKWFWAIFELTSTWPNFTFGQFVTWTGTNNDKYDFLSAKQAIRSNVRTDINVTHFSFGQHLTELAYIITTYDSHGLNKRFWAMIESTSAWYIFTFGQLFTCIGTYIMTTYDTLYRRNKRYWAMFDLTLIWPNFAYGQLLTWIGTHNDHIWIPKVNFM